jgi:hypothetical protein
MAKGTKGIVGNKASIKRPKPQKPSHWSICGNKPSHSSICGIPRTRGPVPDVASSQMRAALLVFVHVSETPSAENVIVPLRFEPTTGELRKQAAGKPPMGTSSHKAAVVFVCTRCQSGHCARRQCSTRFITERVINYCDQWHLLFPRNAVVCDQNW